MIFVEHIVYPDGKTEENDFFAYPDTPSEDIPLMSYPIMVGSDDCLCNNGFEFAVSEDNPCGYYIVKGQ
jgi:hypothetical protein